MVKMHISIVGPVAVGKGFTCKQLTKRFENEITIISMGGLIRNRRSIDHDFDRTYGPTVDRGDLLPDEIVSPMLNGALQEPLNPLVVREGWDRNPEQVSWSRRKRILTSDSLFLMLLADEEVCGARNEHRKQHLPDGPRNDAHRFQKRYKLFMKSVGDIEKAARASGATFHKIDANGDLTEVAFRVISYIQEACEITEPSDSRIAIPRTTNISPFMPVTSHAAGGSVTRWGAR